MRRPRTSSDTGRLWPLLALAALQLALAHPARCGSRQDLVQLLGVLPADGPDYAYGDVVLGTAGRRGRMAPVRFSHWSHRTRYTCRVCHTELGFALRSGETPISRSRNLGGRYCGACHDGDTAFSTRRGIEEHCDRCHGVRSRAKRAAFGELAEDLQSAPSGNRLDWVATLAQRDIRPADARGNTPPPTPLPAALEEDLVLGSSEPRSEVRFSHAVHVRQLECSSCHPDTFAIQRGATPGMDMEKNLYGWFCGSCHLRTAFPLTDCHRCHPQMSSKRRF